MAQTLLRLLPMEMALLGAVEFCLLFALIFGMLTLGDAAAVLGGSAGLTHDCLLLTAMLAVTIVGTAATIGMYRPAICLDRRHIVLSATVSALLAFPAILLIGGIYRMSLTAGHVLWLARLLAVWLASLVLVRLTINVLTARLPVTRRVVIAGPEDKAAILIQRLSEKRHGLWRPVPGDDPANQPGQRPWGIILAGDVPVLSGDSLRGVPILTETAFQERHLGRIEPESAAAAGWTPPLRRGLSSLISTAVKRAFDIVVGLALCVLTLPLMLVTALLIKLDSPGPVFYRQERTGLGGESFVLFKFRSMTADAEARGQPQWARQGDPRVTRVGAFIRASRIDELPQLLNVLRGEMSMIGPRPERPLFVSHLAEVIPLYNDRLIVKPGLTGWAQVNFPYGASVEDAREKLAYDLYYVKHRGLLLDLLILLSTIRVILFREGAR